MFKRNFTTTYREEEKGAEASKGGGTELTQAQFDELKTSNDAIKAENESMKSKMDELLGETKKAKNAKREAEEAVLQAAADKAKKDGDFEQLYNSSQKDASSLRETISSMNAKAATNEQSNIANAIATELADGSNVGLLSTFIAPRLKYTEEGIKVLDINGQLTVSTIDDLKAEFQNNAMYSSLLKGNQSSGSGAPGGNSSSAADKTMTRPDFDKLDPTGRMKFMKDGGKIID